MASLLALVVQTFDAEVNHSSTDLNSLIVTREQRRSLLNKHKRSKLALVVLKHKFTILEFNLSVASTDRDVIDAEVGLMTTTKLENIFLRGGPNNVNNAGGVFFLVEGFEHHVVALLLLVVDEFEL